MAVAKVAPAAGVTAGTYTPGYTLSDIALFCTILFTLLQAFSVVVKNWGEWTQWGRALGNGSAGSCLGVPPWRLIRRTLVEAESSALPLRLLRWCWRWWPRLVRTTPHEGRRYTPYYDSAGILTACAGITGPAVVKGKRYTDEECTRLGRPTCRPCWATWGSAFVETSSFTKSRHGDTLPTTSGPMPSAQAPPPAGLTLVSAQQHATKSGNGVT
ncbi:hypothetical protein SNK04_014040 [Fusarium graminearum]